MTIDRNPAKSFLSTSEYLLDNFEPIDRIAMLVLNRGLGEVLPRIITAKKAPSHKPHLQGLRHRQNTTTSTGWELRGEFCRPRISSSLAVWPEA
jgi:hypothetical protein